MEGPASPGETPKKKKRNPSLRRMLRNEGVDVPPVVHGLRDPNLPPKRKRNQKYPGKKRAKKIKTAAAAAAAAATNEANAPHVSAGSSAPGADSSDVGSPVVAPSPSSGISHTVSSSSVTVSPPAAAPSPASAPAEPPKPAEEKADADNVVWDPVDPLGLFDELEGPLDWPSEGLFD
ncbi:hypothetical protein N7527_006451 [Penicillium freii]|uniref:Uncharacterized protein n=1 Tax=Penicillium freii TaxID=48697 RepID=A0A101M8S2_PENFR|nr:hypothetical protein N7527_006451 [Penicillium freii]KUM56005.1 hypothetical protein ACN42_g11228 [Penicillium freii]